MSRFSNIRMDIKRYSYNREISKFKLIIKALSHLGFWAILNYRIGKYLRSKINFKFIYLITGINKIIIEIITGISIPYSCDIGAGMLIAHFSGIIISSNAVIGKNCTLHQNVTIGAAGRNDKRGEPIIKDNVFIGAGAIIIGNITIGNNVAIGANSIVVDNIDDNAVLVCQKAKIINYNGSNNL